MTTATAEHVRRLPKVELHCHLEGSARATTIAELAAANGVELPVADPAQLFTFTDLNQFLSIYHIVCRSLVKEEDFRRIRQLARDGNWTDATPVPPDVFDPAYKPKKTWWKVW